MTRHLARILFALAPIAVLPGCLQYNFPSQCPAYKRGHELTDDRMVEYNAGRPVGVVVPYPDGWHHSTWTERRILVCRQTDATMRAFGIHYRADGSEISRFEASYRLMVKDGGWTIAGRTPGAP